MFRLVVIAFIRGTTHHVDSFADSSIKAQDMFFIVQRCKLELHHRQNAAHMGTNVTFGVKLLHVAHILSIGMLVLVLVVTLDPLFATTPRLPIANAP